ncbi:MAG: anhydro-N-acetylmuramic acid kinase [Planctomycetaceae bacterium]|nr:anhydro-N-acetylmuramic acid kinase [Planctomycetaceae bacterium]
MAFPSLFSRDSQRTARKTSNAVRWIAGVSVTASCQRIESAMIGIHGRGSGAPVEIRKTIAFDIPREIVDSFNELQSALQRQELPASLTLHVAKELACIEEEAILELISESKLTANDVLAVGIHDPGLRTMTSHGIFYQGLCDAAYLAEQTSMNIVDAFPAQDIALRGNGGPTFTLPSWIFLKSEMKPRILIDLGRTARLTFLPQAESPFSHQKIQHIEVCPCGSLIDTLVWQLTGGKTAVDTGGRAAVQGCQNAPLISALRAAVPTTENWSPTGLKPDRYIKIADRAAQDGLSHQDILCSVSCFIAERVAGQALDWIKNAGYVEPELLIQGSGQKHGLLMNSLISHLDKRTLLPIVQLGIPVDTFDGLCTAMLALLAVDHIPGNLPHLTGSETVKPLGRITQGSMSNWHRLLCEMAATKPASRSLRSAG